MLDVFVKKKNIIRDVQGVYTECRPREHLGKSGRTESGRAFFCPAAEQPGRRQGRIAANNNSGGSLNRLLSTCPRRSGKTNTELLRVMDDPPCLAYLVLSLRKNSLGEQREPPPPAGRLPAEDCEFAGAMLRPRCAKRGPRQATRRIEEQAQANKKLARLPGQIFVGEVGRCSSMSRRLVVVQSGCVEKGIDCVMMGGGRGKLLCV